MNGVRDIADDWSEDQLYDGYSQKFKWYIDAHLVTLTREMFIQLPKKNTGGRVYPIVGKYGQKI